MQASATVGSKSLAGSCLANASALERQLLECNSQLVDESISKETPVPASPTRGEQLNEAEAIRRAHDGDAAAFECLYRLHSRRVYALCRRMVGDPTQAEDFTQDTFLLLFRKIHTFRHESAFSTWLHRLTVNLVLMHLRKKSPHTVSIEATSDPDDETRWPSIDDSVPDPLLAGYRTIFVLHDIQGYAHHEIGEILGRSEGDSKSQLHKARMRLRELLHEDQRAKARRERLASRKVPPRALVAA